jgi:hypothetical protein
MSFLQNVQTQLFYPPLWLLFLLQWGRDRLSHQNMQNLVVIHVWLTFVLCFLWLRGKRFHPLATTLGAGLFAFSGVMCSWMPHLGFLAAFSWMPLGFWGIDQAVDQRSWRPLWKLALASAMSFLAGYPPVWFAFVVFTAVYALSSAWRWKVALGAALAGALSLGLVAIQLLPTIEGAALRDPELRYEGLRAPTLLLDFLLPNFADTSLGGAPGTGNPDQFYFYLGVPGLLAIPLLLYTRPRFESIKPALAILATTIVVITDPFDILGRIIGNSVWLADICRPIRFVGGVTLAFTLLTASAVDAFLRKSPQFNLPWSPRATMTFLGAWIAFDLVRWFGPGFPVGWSGWFDVAVPFALLFVGLLAVQKSLPSERKAAIVMLLLFVAVNYKVWGTSKRFNSNAGPLVSYYSDKFFGMDDKAYAELRAHPQARIMTDLDIGPPASRLHHVGLQTPQGFDPFLSGGLHKLLIDSGARFKNDREFDIDPENRELFGLLGVRYVISNNSEAINSKLEANPRFRTIGDPDRFFRVYEYLDAQPSYHGPGALNLTEWTPEKRTFKVNSEGGEVILAEQYHPRWTVTIDGSSVPLEAWKNAFLAANVPAGEHTLVFEFKPEWRKGAIISAISLLVLCGWIVLAYRKTDRLVRNRALGGRSDQPDVFMEHA